MLIDLNRTRGFSLVEVLIAIVILSVSLLALAGLMVQTTKNNSYGSHMTEASTFAQDRMERLRALLYNSMTGGTDVVTGSTGQSYTRTWVITRDASSTTAETTVTINWSDPTNRSISFTYNIQNLDL